MKMNKKMMMIVLAVVLAIAVIGAAFALTADKENASEQTDVQVTTETADQEETDMPEIVEISGEIKEIGEGYILILDAMLGDVQVNLSEDTIFDGVEREELAVGQFVQVMYSGMMTRSLPPQITALKVGVYAIAGEVKAVADGSMTIVREEIGDEVIVFLPENAPEIAVGMQVIAYTNGAMTMSLPAQTTALGVVLK